MGLRKIATLGGVAFAGLALIGAGAAATFTQDTNSNQTVTAGTMNVVLSATGATGNNTPTISLPAVGPTNSTFSAADEVTITNNGDIPVNAWSLKLDDSNSGAAADLALKSQAWVCFYSDGGILFNEPLTTVEGYGSGLVSGPIPVGGQDHYTLAVYAGNSGSGAYAGCGAAFTGFNGTNAYTSFNPYTGSAPTLGVNPAALSLDNSAQGGSLTVKVTVTYQG